MDKDFNSIFHLSQWNNEFTDVSEPVDYQQPQELCHFSINAQNELLFDSSELRVFFPKEFNSQNPWYDLLDGFPEKFIQKELDQPDDLNKIFLTLKRKYEELVGIDSSKSAMLKSIVHSAHVVTWRGIMTNILCTPYLKQGWSILACLIDETLYLMDNKPPKYSSSLSYQEKKNSFIGRKFESLFTTSQMQMKLFIENGKSNLDLLKIDSDQRNRSVNEIESFGTVIKTKLGKNRLILGAEVDCLDSSMEKKNVDPLSKYMELKTTIYAQSYQGEMRFRKYKLLKIWAQSYLAGIPRIIIGHRNIGGRLSSIKNISTVEIPKLVKDQRGHYFWEPKKCLAFANSLISWIRSAISDHDRKKVYKIQFLPPFDSIRISEDKQADSAANGSFVPLWWLDFQSAKK